MEVIKLDDFPINPIQDQIYEIIPDKTKIVASTNRLFNKYPTRYISAVPRFAINAYSKAGETVLDPFCGSGTTAIEAMLLGRNAMSIDIDPFARLLIKVKTTDYSKEDIDFLDEVVRKIKEMVERSETDLYFSAGQTIPHGVTSGIGVWFRSKASSFTRRMRKLEAGWLGFSCGISSDTYKKGELLSGKSVWYT